jgi:hypothetical protein
MKRAKTLTKKERKAAAGNPGASAGHAHGHIHCVSCGRHLDPAEFTGSPVSARFVRCQHGSKFACCVGCTVRAQALLDEHDRTGKPVESAAAWH